MAKGRQRENSQRDQSTQVVTRAIGSATMRLVHFRDRARKRGFRFRVERGCWLGRGSDEGGGRLEGGGFGDAGARVVGRGLWVCRNRRRWWVEVWGGGGEGR